MRLKKCEQLRTRNLTGQTYREKLITSDMSMTANQVIDNGSYEISGSSPTLGFYFTSTKESI